MVLVSACHELLAPGDIPEGAPAAASATAPLPEYATWWTDIENCLGVQAHFGRVSWATVSTEWGKGFACTVGELGTCYGLWSSPHFIYLAGWAARDPMLVKHEMIHDILGTGSHASPAFKDCIGL